MDEKNINTEEVAPEETADKAPKTEKKENKETKKLREQLEKTEAELAAANDKYLRMIAEYDNFRKRSQKEKEGVYADAYADALTAIIPVIDNLERALAFSEGATLTEGVKMTLKQFEDALSRLGVEAYGARGDDFDPRFHNAVMQAEDPEMESGKISEVFQKGYKKGDKIIRDAMVKVAN